MAADKPGQGNIFSRSTAFFSESWEELKKVHTPTREETIRASLGVLAMVFIFSIFLGLTDWLVGTVMQKVLTS